MFSQHNHFQQLTKSETGTWTYRDFSQLFEQEVTTKEIKFYFITRTCTTYIILFILFSGHHFDTSWFPRLEENIVYKSVNHMYSCRFLLYDTTEDNYKEQYCTSNVHVDRVHVLRVKFYKRADANSHEQEIGVD